MVRADIDELLAKPMVTFCVDTNLLVEFVSLDSIPWHELAPHAVEVMVIVPTKVAEEMDAHKKKSGRLRRRGMEFSKLARVIEESPNGAAELRASNPKVTVKFGNIFRRSELDGDLYELDDDDGRIVAEVAKIMEQQADIIFLSDDSKPIRLAKQTNLPHQRPLASWRREEGPDERDLEIEDLRRTIGAEPALEIAFPREYNDRHEHSIELPPTMICSACTDRLVGMALAVDQQVPQDSLIRRYGIKRASPFGISLPFEQGLNEDDLSRYESDYQAFTKRVHAWAEKLPKLLRTFGTIVPVEIEIKNDGTRAAERVLVEAELRGSFHFAPRYPFDKVTRNFLRPPNAPKPAPNFLSPHLFHNDPVPEHRADHFYVQDKPQAEQNSKHISWRWEEVLHGSSHVLMALAVAEGADARGALSVRASGAFIPKTVEVTAPFVPASATTGKSFREYIMRHIELLPRKYQEESRAALAKPGPECTCGSKQ